MPTEFLRVTEIFHSIQGESSWVGLPCTFVRLTGCPLRCVWCDTERFLDEGLTVLVETSGAMDVSPLDPRCHVIMDLKCPGSGEEAKNLWSNLDHLDGRDEVKFVIRDRVDYEWARDTVREHELDRRVEAGTLRAILFSPVWGEQNRLELAEWILEDRLPVRYQLQLHKLVWGPDVAGV